ncbi:MAG: hypothetical protein SFV81_05905, partial [Pirellulaceae bacterium]|nr:hypothetical protein [Pirellulaceae bacterium]
MSAVAVASEPRLAVASTRTDVLLSNRMPRQLWYLAIVAVGTSAALVAALLSVYIHPAPRVHDEFSYMLAGDTILHGRLANPTPPAWEALQSFHTVMQPTYASKYPVGVGLLVALGMLVGNPLISSWLAAALMVASVTWMLAGVLPKRWALAG